MAIASFAPTLEVFLNQIIEILSPSLPTNSFNHLETQISLLIDCLRRARCLLVLDNIDTILDSKSSVKAPSKDTSTGDISRFGYQPGYENYGELIRRIGETQHQSCLLLTSREKPPEISTLEGEKLLVRTYKLTGLDLKPSMLLLKDKGLVKLPLKESEILIEWYAGNPLFIKLVATAIQELFAGNIHQFVSQNILVFADIRQILDQQFQRLSDVEKLVMYWLALNHDFVSVLNLPTDIIPGLSSRLSQMLILEAIDSLQKRFADSEKYIHNHRWRNF